MLQAVKRNRFKNFKCFKFENNSISFPYYNKPIQLKTNVLISIDRSIFMFGIIKDSRAC